MKNFTEQLLNQIRDAKLKIKCCISLKTMKHFHSPALVINE